jgi:hypothetical protein
VKFSPTSTMVFEETLPSFSTFTGRGKTKEQGPLHLDRKPHIKCIHFVTLSRRQVYLTGSLHSVSIFVFPLMLVWKSESLCPDLFAHQDMN